jgi:acyl-CoA dehydrogenase
MAQDELPFFDLTRLPGTTDEHRQIQQATRRFVEQEIAPFASEWDEAEGFPRELYRKAAAIGLLGLGYPAEYGGTPCDQLSKVLMTLELCRAGVGGVNASLMSHTIMLWPLLVGAHESVKRDIVPRILAGDAIGALGITEASGGSDVAQLRTRAERVPGGWKLNGSKMFITSGVRADHVLVAARTGGPGASGVSLLLVDGASKGFSRTPLKKMGWWSSDTAALYFDDVFVPEERLVGPENGGFRLVMQNFNSERIGMAAGAMGFSMVCVEDALAWARERKTFGQPLIGHQVIRHKIVRMIEEIQATQAWIVGLCQQLDAGASPAGEIALVKSHAARMMRDCADTAVQILGGAGFLRGGRVERIFRETKVMMIGGGAEEVMTDLAARQLGLV